MLSHQYIHWNAEKTNNISGSSAPSTVSVLIKLWSGRSSPQTAPLSLHLPPKTLIFSGHSVEVEEVPTA